MEDVLLALQGDDLPGNAVLLTFDDGYSDHYSAVMPLLCEMNIYAAFFPSCMNLETERLMDANKIHFILAAGDIRNVYEALLKEIEFYRGSEFDLPDTPALLQDYAVPGRFDCGEINFIKRMLQTVLPHKLRENIADKLFRRFVGVDESVLSKELYCDATQLADMKRRGMFIGLHGSCHGWLGNMEKTEYENDILHALDYMDSIGLVDRRAWVMNYPYGSYSDGVVSYIQEHGCLAGLTTNVGIADLHNDNRFLLPRLDTNDFPPKSEQYMRYM